MTISGMYSKIAVNREATYRQGGSRSSYGIPGEKSFKSIQTSPPTPQKSINPQTKKLIKIHISRGKV